MPDDRPRDRLGRPAQAEEAYPGIPDFTAASDEQAWSAALGYLDRSLPFHAHEVFETRWRTCPAADRPAWRALAQWGAALTHDARGNTVGARRLAQRTLDTLGSAPSVPGVVDVDRVRQSCLALLTP